MPTVHLLCGLPTSGKTQLAKRLEVGKDAVRFTLDARMLAKTDLSIFEAEYGRLVQQEKELIWEEAQTALADGQDVILDWSLWSRAARAAWTTRVTTAGYHFRLYFLDVPLGALLERLEQRNAARLDGVHAIPPAELERFSHIFEAPTVTENIPFETVHNAHQHVI